MKKIIFLPLAEQELNEAAIFYETHSQGLGRAFLFTIKKETDGITHRPRSYPVLRNGIRRKLVRRFPYAILYFEEKEQIVVIAVMHLHRAPDYWRHRVSEPIQKMVKF